MSTNKPGIGPAVLQIAYILRKYWQILHAEIELSAKSTKIPGGIEHFYFARFANVTRHNNTY